MMARYTYIDTHSLIAAVKVRPGLYDRNNPQYSCMKHRDLWLDVLKELVSNWEELKSHDRVRYGHEVRRRWKNLRTCFTREIVQQMQEKSNREKNIENKPRKVYGYFKDMMFLLPHTSITGAADFEFQLSNYFGADEDNDSETSSSSPKQKHKKMKTEVVFEEIPEIPVVNGIDEDPIESSSIPRIFANSSSSHLDLDFQREEDDDKQFLLSLVPSFRKLSDKQKFDAKIEILKVMKNITFSQSDDN